MVKPKTARKLVATKRADNSSHNEKYFSRAVSKALQALEFLRNEANSMSMNEIARRLQLSKTSAFRLLKTLEATGYVAQDGRGQYKLAPGIHAVTPTQWLGKLVRVAVPHLQALTNETTETVSLAALFENRIEVVAVIESPHVIRMSNVVGHVLPPNASSLGKAIIAFQPAIGRERLLRSFRSIVLPTTPSPIRVTLLMNMRAYGNSDLPWIAKSARTTVSVFRCLSLDRTTRYRLRLVCRCQSSVCEVRSMKTRSSPR